MIALPKNGGDNRIVPSGKDVDTGVALTRGMALCITCSAPATLTFRASAGVATEQDIVTDVEPGSTLIVGDQEQGQVLVSCTLSSEVWVFDPATLQKAPAK